MGEEKTKKNLGTTVSTHNNINKDMGLEGLVVRWDASLVGGVGCDGRGEGVSGRGC